MKLVRIEASSGSASFNWARRDNPFNGALMCATWLVERRLLRVGVPRGFLIVS